MARNLTRAALEDSEAPYKIEEPFGSAEREDSAVLSGDGPVAFGYHGLKVEPSGCKVSTEDRVFLVRGHWTICDRGYAGVRIFLVAPGLPELLWSPNSSEPRFLPVHRQQQLAEVEQLRDVVFVLIADELAARLLQTFGRPLILDYRERDPVDVGDDVAPLGLDATSALYRDFSRHMEDVVLWSIPIDKAERVALAIAVDGFRYGCAENESVVDVLICALQAFQAIRRRLQSAHGLVGILQVKGIFASPIAETVDR